MGYTPLLLSQEIRFANFFGLRTWTPRAQGYPSIEPLMDINRSVGQLATPPLWGGVGWPIGPLKKKLGQEYSFGETLYPSRAAQPRRGCPGTLDSEKGLT